MKSRTFKDEPRRKREGKETTLKDQLLTQKDKRSTIDSETKRSERSTIDSQSKQSSYTG